MAIVTCRGEDRACTGAFTHTGPEAPRSLPELQDVADPSSVDRKVTRVPAAPTPRALRPGQSGGGQGMASAKSHPHQPQVCCWSPHRSGPVTRDRWSRLAEHETRATCPPFWESVDKMRRPAACASAGLRTDGVMPDSPSVRRRVAAVTLCAVCVSPRCVSGTFQGNDTRQRTRFYSFARASHLETRSPLYSGYVRKKRSGKKL